MTTLTPSATAIDLAGVRAQFDAWRATRRGASGRIPDHLWALALALLSSHSASDVARELRLHPERLRRRHIEMTRESRAPRRQRSPRQSPAVPPAFVELAPDALAAHAHRTGGDLRRGQAPPRG